MIANCYSKPLNILIKTYGSIGLEPGMLCGMATEWRRSNGLATILPRVGRDYLLTLYRFHSKGKTTQPYKYILICVVE